jgi:hypothetical protein
MEIINRYIKRRPFVAPFVKGVEVSIGPYSPSRILEPNTHSHVFVTHAYLPTKCYATHIPTKHFEFS